VKLVFEQNLSKKLVDRLGDKFPGSSVALVRKRRRRRGNDATRRPETGPAAAQDQVLSRDFPAEPDIGPYSTACRGTDLHHCQRRLQARKYGCRPRNLGTCRGLWRVLGSNQRRLSRRLQTTMDTHQRPLDY